MLQGQSRLPAETKDTDYKSAVKFDEKTDFAAKLADISWGRPRQLEPKC